MAVLLVAGLGLGCDAAKAESIAMGQMADCGDADHGPATAPQNHACTAACSVLPAEPAVFAARHVYTATVTAPFAPMALSGETLRPDLPPPRTG